jgi:hypothetical protein
MGATPPVVRRVRARTVTGVVGGNNQAQSRWWSCWVEAKNEQDGIVDSKADLKQSSEEGGLGRELFLRLLFAL